MAATNRYGIEKELDLGTHTVFFSVTIEKCKRKTMSPRSFIHIVEKWIMPTYLQR